MTQIVVNFLQPNDVNSSVLATDPRIFDFEISQDAQSYYNYELTQILLGLGAQIKDANGVLHPPTPTTLNAGTIVFGGPTSAQTVSDAINLLNNWSKMRQINSQGFQTFSYGNFGTNTDVEGSIVPNTTGTPAIPASPFIITSDPNDASVSTTNPKIIMVPADAGASGVATLTTTMDQYMAQGLDKLIRTLRAAGWDPIGDPTNSANAQAAITNVTGANATVYGLANVLQQAISAASQAHLKGNAALSDSMSIQQVLMVDYVSRGNEILFNEMNQLKSAVDLNQQALSYLNSLQDLMNQKDPQKFIMQLQLLNNVNINTQSPQGTFDSFEKATYDQSLQTLTRISSETPDGYKAYFNNLAQGDPIPDNAQLAASAFDDLNTAAKNIATYSASTITANLTYLVQQLGSAGSPANGLVLALNKINSDFQNLVSQDPANALKNWIQDTQTADPGGFQRNLSNAIVSSQSFNDTERENLREVMFVFEEFYKSATGLLSRLTQLIEKMADGIAR